MKYRSRCTRARKGSKPPGKRVYRAVSLIDLPAGKSVTPSLHRYDDTRHTDPSTDKGKHFSGNCVTSHLIISTSRGVRSENSSDLDMGRRPVSKSDEFSDLTPLVIEKLWCEQKLPSYSR